jgi:hypothetical protein
VRIFQKDGRGSEAFICEDWGGYTAVDDKMKLYLGLARDVQVTRTIAANDRRDVTGNLYHREVTLAFEIKNFKNEPVTLDITEDLRHLRDQLCGRKDHEPEWEIIRAQTTLPRERIEQVDSHTVEFHIPLPAAPKGDADIQPLTFNVTLALRNEW